jgi:uncharacterized repeat protein (TIGR02543 family)
MEKNPNMKKIAFIFLFVILLSMSACTMPTNDNVHTVTFDANGGSEVSQAEVSQLEQSPQTTKENHIFCGWYRDSELTLPVTYPFNVTRDMTLYAKWVKSTDTLVCENASVQFSYDSTYSYKADYLVNPSNLDLMALAEQGYDIKIDVTYEVYYEKNMPFGIGHLGAPDHDVHLTDSYDQGVKNENLSTSETPTEESISLVVSAEKLSSRNYYLRLMTYNLQSTVHFQNIRITYTCQLNQ